MLAGAKRFRNPVMFGHALARLTSMFPNTLSGWDVRDQPGKIEWCEGIDFDVVSLALRYQLVACLPAMLYIISKTYTMVSLVRVGRQHLLTALPPGRN